MAPAAEMTVDWELDLSAHNKRWIEWYWTKDGERVGDRKKGHGHAIRDPRPGGNGGGGPVSPGQEGGGGSYVHQLDVYNLFDKPVQLRLLDLLASMTYYDSLDEIPWDNTLKVLDATGLTLTADGDWTYLFETTGAYVGGHVYYRYEVVDDTSRVVGDHPIPVPEPSVLTMLMIGALTLGKATRHKSCRYQPAAGFPLEGHHKLKAVALSEAAGKIQAATHA